MTEQELKLEARLFAMEYMIGHTLSRIHVMSGATDEQLDAIEAGADAARAFQDLTEA